MEEQPEFLDEEAIIEFHEQELQLLGGAGGIGNPDGLSAAVKAPQNLWAYDTQATLFDIAATYAYNIAQAQAFVEGNKRTGLRAALAFIEMNGYEVTSDPKALFEHMEHLHEGIERRAQFAEHLCKCSVRKNGLTMLFRSIFD